MPQILPGTKGSQGPGCVGGCQEAGVMGTARGTGTTWGCWSWQVQVRQKTGATEAIWGHNSCLGSEELRSAGGVAGHSKHRDDQKPGSMAAYGESPRAGWIQSPSWNLAHFILFLWGRCLSPSLSAPAWGNSNMGDVNPFFLPSVTCPFLFLCFAQVLESSIPNPWLLWRYFYA